ncbi:hypothetical protein ACFQ58_02545 [Agromyces sp. NPDC056523]|uniref:hypothetical protein n=1 Tax=Agromyces sp. NPDC056523 TaxID=3345850 RepID=UPI00366ED8BB
MTYETTHEPVPVARRHALGIPFLAIIGLAVLGVPRVILNDLHIVDEADPVTWLLAIGPVVAWILVALLAKVPNPFLTLLVTGVVFGAMLVITHQLLWDAAFAGDLPSVGDSQLGTVIPRFAAIPSGLVTGTLIGAVGGLIAWGIQAATSRTGSAR